MAINFPDAPTAGASVTVNNVIYTFDGVSWNGYSQASVVNGPDYSQIPLGPPEGLTIARNTLNPTTHLDVSPGRTLISNGTSRLVSVLPSTMTKRIDQAWVSGSGNGGRFSGSLSADQTWHVFLMRNNTTTAIDVGFSTLAGGGDAPSGWSVRRIGSWILNSSSQLMNIVQNDNRFIHTTTVLSASTVFSTTATLYKMAVPTGISVMSMLGIFTGDATSISYCYLVTSPLSNDEDPIRPRMPGGNADAEVFRSGATVFFSHCPYKEVLTNTSGQVRIRATNAAGFDVANPSVRTLGWIDNRIN